MDKCRFDKPMPASPDSYYVADCERSYEQQEKNLAVLSEAEKKEPRAVAVFEEMQRRHPELPDGVRRTMERRIRSWRHLKVCTPNNDLTDKM